MEKVNLLKKKRLVFTCIALALLIATLIFVLVSFKLVSESNYIKMWYFFALSVVFMYVSVYFLVLALDYNLYFKVAHKIEVEGITDEDELSGVLNIKAKSLKKIINKCKRKGYLA